MDKFRGDDLEVWRVAVVCQTSEPAVGCVMGGAGGLPEPSELSVDTRR
jgi:hypothetical protein